MRVLVTVSRNWEDRALLERELDALLAEHGTLTLVHGAASKGDSMAHNWGLSRRHASSYGAVTLEPHPADWKRHGKAAGPIRNAEMVADGADTCLAFVAACSKPSCREPKPHGSHGATHCADLAEKAGIPVKRFEEDQ